jgi:hypothetical protein
MRRGNVTEDIMRRLYPFLNLLFHALHACIIFFTVFGWLLPSWRLAHFVWVLLTLASWYVLGIWMGMGYCPITDLHWTIKEKLGKGRPQCNFIYYWLTKVSNTQWDPERVDHAIVIITILTCIISACFNIWDYLS